jgi:hypothetical protein
VVKLGLHDLTYHRADARATATVILDPDRDEVAEEEEAGSETERGA